MFNDRSPEHSYQKQNVARTGQKGASYPNLQGSKNPIQQVRDLKSNIAQPAAYNVKATPMLQFNHTAMTEPGAKLGKSGTDYGSLRRDRTEPSNENMHQKFVQTGVAGDIEPRK